MELHSAWDTLIFDTRRRDKENWGGTSSQKIQNQPLIMILIQETFLFAAKREQ